MTTLSLTEITRGYNSNEVILKKYKVLPKSLLANTFFVPTNVLAEWTEGLALRRDLIYSVRKGLELLR